MLLRLLAVLACAWAHAPRPRCISLRALFPSEVLRTCELYRCSCKARAAACAKACSANARTTTAGATEARQDGFVRGLLEMCAQCRCRRVHQRKLAFHMIPSTFDQWHAASAAFAWTDGAEARGLQWSGPFDGRSCSIGPPGGCMNPSSPLSHAPSSGTAAAAATPLYTTGDKKDEGRAEEWLAEAAAAPTRDSISAVVVCRHPRDSGRVGGKRRDPALALALAGTLSAFELTAAPIRQPVAVAPLLHVHPPLLLQLVDSCTVDSKSLQLCSPTATVSPCRAMSATAPVE
jgi:hypothetical protein